MHICYQIVRYVNCSAKCMFVAFIILFVMMIFIMFNLKKKRQDSTWIKRIVGICAERAMEKSLHALAVTSTEFPTLPILILKNSFSLPLAKALMKCVNP